MTAPPPSPALHPSRRPAPPSIAIVGAGFGGLSLAIALEYSNAERHNADNPYSVTIFESRSSNAGCVIGDLCLPNGKKSLKRLGMSQVWNDLVRQTDRPKNVPQETLQRAMKSRLKDYDIQIRYNHRVNKVEYDATNDRLHCRIDSDAKRSKGKCVSVGPFDFVVGADGVLSTIQKSCSLNCGRIGVIGDARAQNGLDFGIRRIRCGADVAIQDGLELADMLLLQEKNVKSLGKFCVHEKRRERLRRRGNASINLLAILLCLFAAPFDDARFADDIFVAMFVAALVHIGGNMRFRLPVSISSIPITLHTLSASWAGLTLGPTRASIGAGLYSFFWIFYHVYTNNNIASCGYIVGLISCATISGNLHQLGFHPFTASALGQCSTVMFGFLWLLLQSKGRGSADFFARVVVFIPGLFVKSLMAWGLATVNNKES